MFGPKGGRSNLNARESFMRRVGRSVFERVGENDFDGGAILPVSEFENKHPYVAIWIEWARAEHWLKLTDRRNKVYSFTEKALKELKKKDDKAKADAKKAEPEKPAAPAAAPAGTEKPTAPPPKVTKLEDKAPVPSAKLPVPNKETKFAELAENKQVLVHVLTMIVVHVNKGFMKSSDMMKEIMKEPGWEKAAWQGVTRMLSKMAVLGFLTARGVAGTRAYAVSQKGAKEVLGLDTSVQFEPEADDLSWRDRSKAKKGKGGKPTKKVPVKGFTPPAESAEDKHLSKELATAKAEIVRLNTVIERMSERHVRDTAQFIFMSLTSLPEADQQQILEVLQQAAGADKQPKIPQSTLSRVINELLEALFEDHTSEERRMVMAILLEGT